MAEPSSPEGEGDLGEASFERRWSAVCRNHSETDAMLVTSGRRGVRTPPRTAEGHITAAQRCDTAMKLQQDYVQQQLLLFSPPPVVSKGFRRRRRDSLLQEESTTATEEAAAAGRAAAEAAAAEAAAAKDAAVDALLLQRTAIADPELGQLLLLLQHINQQLGQVLQANQHLKGRRTLSEAAGKDTSYVALPSAGEAGAARRVARDDAAGAAAEQRRVLLGAEPPQPRDVTAAAAAAEAAEKETELASPQESLLLGNLLSARDRTLFTALMLAEKEEKGKIKTGVFPWTPPQQPPDIPSPEGLDEAWPSRAAATAFDEQDVEMGVTGVTGEACSRRVDARICRVFGEGLQRATAGIVAQFRVQSVYADGSFVRRGGTRFSAFLQSDAPAAFPPSSSSSCRTGEEHQQQLGAPQGEAAKAEDPEAASVTATAAATAAAAQQQQQGTLFFSQRSAHLRQGSCDAHVYDHGDGTYTVSYYCTRAVPHTLWIYLDDCHLVGKSPYQVEVNAGAVCPSRCRIYGAGVQSFARNGEVNEVFVQLRDAHGNDVKRGGEDVKALSRGAAKIVETRDLHDGRFWITYFVPAGAEENFVELHILHGQQHVKNSPFRPVAAVAAADCPPAQASSSETTLKTQASFVNPYISLKQLLQEFDRKSRCGVRTPPTLPTFPPFPSFSEAQDALAKAGLLSAEVEFTELLNNVTKTFLRDTTTELVQYGRTTVGRENLLRELVEKVTGHGDAGAVQHYIEKRSKQCVKNISSSVSMLQHELQSIYKSIQHGVVDVLPVAFEIEDPDEIRAAHAKRREALVQRHRALEKKQQELRLREQQLIDGRLRYVTELSSEIQHRREMLSLQRAALKENINYAQRLSQLSLKRHLRREMLLACEREAVEAFKSRTWQREFSRMLEQAPLIGGAAAATATAAAARRDAAQREAAAAAPPPQPKVIPTCPDDPLRPATWLFKGAYCEPLEEAAAWPKLRPVADRVMTPSPSCVATAEGKFSRAETAALLQQQKKQRAAAAGSAARAAGYSVSREAGRSRLTSAVAEPRAAAAAVPTFSLPKRGAEKKETSLPAATAAADVLPSFGRGARREEAAAAGREAAAIAAGPDAAAAGGQDAEKVEDICEGMEDTLDDVLPPPGISLKELPKRIYLQIPPPPPPPPPRHM